LYALARGVYEYDVVLLTHPDGNVLKLQVGYLDGTDPLRQVFQTVVDSLGFDTIGATGEVEAIDYRHLQAHLMAGEWQAADLETRSILQQLISTYDYFYPSIEADGIEALRCEDLQILDALWSRYSNGRYGFTAQHQVWRSLTVIDPTIRAERFGQHVQWQRAEPLPNTPFGSSLWRSDTELTYTTDAPIGHLPWSGVSSLTLERMLEEGGLGCGSCTIDAFYISEDRLAHYLNAFMARVDECLCDQARSQEQS
ncbi:MAG: GUN4 domain-containing protein, partial [Leptolyngbya sp. SIO1D8]|nr:GUN4 domain-containing protein [Leptolyngbya sp. SIO1D8]